MILGDISQVYMKAITYINSKYYKNNILGTGSVSVFGWWETDTVSETLLACI
jgi:hypothetical protein